MGSVPYLLFRGNGIEYGLDAGLGLVLLNEMAAVFNSAVGHTLASGHTTIKGFLAACGNRVCIAKGTALDNHAEDKMETHPDLDVFMWDEPILTMRDLFTLDSWQEVKGITYREQNKVQVNPPRDRVNYLDLVPFPARHLLDDKDDSTFTRH